MKKEKEVCFVYSHEFNGKFYVKVEDFKEVIERLISIREENRKLKVECEENNYLVEDNARWIKKCEEKTMEIKKLKKRVIELEKEREFLLEAHSVSAE